MMIFWVNERDGRRDGWMDTLVICLPPHPPTPSLPRTHIVWFRDAGRSLSLSFCSLLLFLCSLQSLLPSPTPPNTPARRHLVFGTLAARLRARTLLLLRLSLIRLIRAFCRGSNTFSQQEGGNHDHGQGRQLRGEGGSAAGPGTSAELKLTPPSR